MRALYFEEHGGVDRLQIGDRPLPEPGPGEVRIRLRTAALNQLDLFVLQGMPGVEIGLPHIGGADGAGIVDSLGPGVEGVAVGDEVVYDPGLSCGGCEFCRKGEQSLCVRFGVVGEQGDGSFADAVVVPAAGVAPRPVHLSWEESAAFPLTYVTAWRMLFSRGGLRHSQVMGGGNLAKQKAILMQTLGRFGNTVADGWGGALLGEVADGMPARGMLMKSAE